MFAASGSANGFRQTLLAGPIGTIDAKLDVLMTHIDGGR